MELLNNKVIICFKYFYNSQHHLDAEARINFKKNGIVSFLFMIFSRIIT